MTFLLLNQTFHPDVMATGMYLSELAVRLVERGHQVTVVTSRLAYDQPATAFLKQETWRGVRVFRVGSTGFGKGAKWPRVADFASFMLACCWRLARLPRHDAVVALTTPPLISFVGAWLARRWRALFFYWVMDFNPDEAIAAGWLRPGSLVTRLLERMSRFSLRRAKKIIALDRFMRDRIVAKGIAPERIAVISPWSHDAEVRFDPAGRQQFRQAHRLEGKFVVMYSGNHSPIHPLTTLLGAAQQLAAYRDIAFCFIGGGSEWRKIKDQSERSALPSPGRRPPATVLRPPAPVVSGLSLLCLPYQPLDRLASSLSAADLHVVVMGNNFVGLVHPCKIYNILRVGAPVLYIGPQPSHLSELLEPIASAHPCALVGHGDVQGVVEAICSIRQQSSAALRTPSAQIRARFSKEALLFQLVTALEAT